MTIFLLDNNTLFQKRFTRKKMQCNNHLLKVKSIKLYIPIIINNISYFIIL